MLKYAEGLSLLLAWKIVMICGKITNTLIPEAKLWRK
jgi:hypothetical protein